MDQHAPRRFHHQHHAPAAAPAKPGAQYTCPMHPQIVRDAPGSCPICGMALVPIAGTGEADDSELQDLTRRFWIGTMLSIPLVLLAMAPMAGIVEPLGLAPRPRGWVELLLGTPVVLWVGGPILKKFWLSVSNWSLNMHSLIGLGVGLAYLYSLASVFAPGIFPEEFREHGAVGTYFEAAAVIGRAGRRFSTSGPSSMRWRASRSGLSDSARCSAGSPGGVAAERGEIHDDHSRHKDSGGVGRWVFWGFVLIAGFFLITEHRAHVFQYLPFLLLAACPLMHVLHGHGGHGGRHEGGEEGSADKNSEPASKHSGGCH